MPNGKSRLARLNNWRGASFALAGPFLAALLTGKVVPYGCWDASCSDLSGEFGTVWVAMFVVALVTVLNLVPSKSPMRVICVTWLAALAVGSLFFATQRFYAEDVMVGAAAAGVMLASSIGFVAFLPGASAPVPRPRTAALPLAAQAAPAAVGHARPATPPRPGRRMPARARPHPPWGPTPGGRARRDNG
ncbi:MAG: hypothetical protein HYT80_04775 [Euryarchaeota archaeon]|nr:hypothetical protein [Euryarchaeota archaeon]